MYSWLSVHVRCSKYLNSRTSIKHRFHPCMDNMARSFPFTIGSPLKMRRKWTANTHQHAHADTHQLAFFYIWPNDIDECRLERICHVGAYLPCWCVFAGRLVRICHVGAYILNVASYILNVEYLVIWRSIADWLQMHIPSDVTRMSGVSTYDRIFLGYVTFSSQCIEKWDLSTKTNCI